MEGSGCKWKITNRHVAHRIRVLPQIFVRFLFFIVPCDDPHFVLGCDGAHVIPSDCKFRPFDWAECECGYKDFQWSYFAHRRFLEEPLRRKGCQIKLSQHCLQCGTNRATELHTKPALRVRPFLPASPPLHLRQRSARGRRQATLLLLRLAWQRCSWSFPSR